MTHVIPGHEDSGYTIDTIEVPYDVQNAFRTPMRMGGVGVLSDGSLVVCTIIGDVWIVRFETSEAAEGSGAEQQRVRWQRLAAGLYQPLGLVVQSDQILVLGRDQITRLHDLNGDGEADFYECYTNQYPTTDGHDFATSLQQDQTGRLHWVTASHDWGVTRMSDNGPESLASGLRNSNGMGVSPDGEILLATVQEGTWTPASAIFDVSKGSYHGLKGPREGHGEYGYDLPMCFIPRGIDNSSGELIFLPKDDRFGPLSGQLIGSSYGNCSHYLVLREPLSMQQNPRLKSQGAVVPLPGEFLSGACRFAFSRHDGCLYVAGTEGWQSYATQNGCLQRVRYTGKPVVVPTSMETHSNGIMLKFSDDIDPAAVRLENVFCQQWNYLYSAGYGSPEYSVTEPERTGHDYVAVRSVHLLKDGRSVFLEIPQLHPVMQFHVHMKLKSRSGHEFTPDLYATLYEFKPDFRDFDGYQLFAKKRSPGFPKAEKLAIDPRLEKQDRLGTDFGWVQSAMKLSIEATPGLQFEPKRLRVPPGARVALTFQNADPSMPHNVAIVKADQMEAFGEASMMLASNPRAIATHYVPDDPAEICFSPILNPNERYTVFFEAPKEQGEYRMICTYPGHWRVMRGSLFVLPEDQPLPASAESDVRKFVKQWTVDDLSADASALRGRNFERGKAIFAQAGCIKCHRMGAEGEKLGPELTNIVERFQGLKLLQQVLDPSTEINKQYQTWVAVTNEGRTVTGLMVEQTDQTISLLPNPLKPETKVELRKADLEELFASPQSTMPAGLLMVYERSEILDLLAYLTARGKPEHAVFGK